MGAVSLFTKRSEKMTKPSNQTTFSRREIIAFAGVGAAVTLFGACANDSTRTQQKFAAVTANGLPEYVQKRTAGLYQLDANAPTRRSHENPEIVAIYSEFLGEPLSEVSEKLLHTTYTPRV